MADLTVWMPVIPVGIKHEVFAQVDWAHVHHDGPFRIVSPCLSDGSFALASHHLFQISDETTKSCNQYCSSGGPKLLFMRLRLAYADVDLGSKLWARPPDRCHTERCPRWSVFRSRLLCYEQAGVEVLHGAIVGPRTRCPSSSPSSVAGQCARGGTLGNESKHGELNQTSSTSLPSPFPSFGRSTLEPKQPSMRVLAPDFSAVHIRDKKADAMAVLCTCPTVLMPAHTHKQIERQTDRDGQVRSQRVRRRDRETQRRRHTDTDPIHPTLYPHDLLVRPSRETIS